MLIDFNFLRLFDITYKNFGANVNLIRNEALQSFCFEQYRRLVLPLRHFTLLKTKKHLHNICVRKFIIVRFPCSYFI